MNQPKTQPTKPSAGALRAAKRISDMVRSTPVYGLTENEDMDSMAAQIIDSETNLAQLEADSKKLREPATHNAGHKSNLSVALWDCPVCTQLLRDQLQKVEELVQMTASYQERILKNPTDVDSYPTAADIFGKNREVEAALGGKAE